MEIVWEIVWSGLTAMVIIVIAIAVAIFVYVYLLRKLGVVEKREPVNTRTEPSTDVALVVKAETTPTGRTHEIVIDIDGFHGRPLYWTIAFCIMLTFTGYMIQFAGFNDVGPLTFIACAIYVWVSFETVPQEYMGLIRLFDKGTYRVGPGLTFVPRFIMKLDLELRLDRQDVFPGRDDQIFYGDLERAGTVLPLGMVKPIRQLFGPPKSGDPVPDTVYAPYHKQMVAEVKFAVNWYIYDLLKFRTTIGTVKAAKAQMQATAKGVFATQFSQATPAVIMMRLEQESRTLEQTLDKVVEAWGAEIISAPIEPLQFSHDLNKSVTKTSEVEQEAKQTEISSTADAGKIERVGNATAKAKRASAQVDVDMVRGRYQAEADGKEQIRLVAQKANGLDVLQLETVRAGLENNPNLTIITGEEGLAKSVASLAKIWKGGDKQERLDEATVE